MLVVSHRHQVVKRAPIKGLRGDTVAFAAFLAQMRQEARSDWRVWVQRQQAA